MTSPCERVAIYARADSVEDKDSVPLKLEVVVEFREKLDVTNPVDDDESELEVVLFLPLLLVTEEVLEVTVVSFAKLAREADVVSFGAMLIVGAIVVSSGELTRDGEGVVLGAINPETPLMRPDTTDAGSSVTTPGMSSKGRESDAANDNDSARSAGVVATLDVEISLMLGLAGVETVRDSMAEP